MLYQPYSHHVHPLTIGFSHQGKFYENETQAVNAALAANGEHCYLTPYAPGRWFYALGRGRDYVTRVTVRLEDGVPVSDGKPAHVVFYDKFFKYSAGDAKDGVFLCSGNKAVL